MQKKTHRKQICAPPGADIAGGKLRIQRRCIFPQRLCSGPGVQETGGLVLDAPQSGKVRTVNNIGVLGMGQELEECGNTRIINAQALRKGPL
jgi:hypothetical protein